ncbi:MAG: ShlB/FhaC/HecB family hemolysin secretion/activation protein [Syntrophobacteraceae bacterium]
MNVETMGTLNQRKRFIFIAVLLVSVLPGFACRCCAQQPAQEQAQEQVQQPAQELSFPIAAFLVEGNTLLPPEVIQDTLEGIIGPGKKASDVETARDTLEKLYHSKGYPTVLVGIPEQRVQEGIIRLDVTESKVAKVATVGNRYITAEKILRGLPSMEPGGVLYTPEVQKQIGKANENADVKVTPSLSPGTEAGTVDVDLNVQDKLPLHATLEVSNRNSPDTTPLRLNAVVHYDNFWQMDHSISLQYQTSPEDPSQVEVGAAAYSMPAPWNVSQTILLSGIWTNSNTAFGEGFSTVGNGHMFGLRYVMPLPGFTDYTHNLILGVDYKDFQNVNVQLANVPSSKSNGENPPVTYFPLSFVYTSFLTDPRGMTQFSAGLNMAFRGLISEEEAFAQNRFDARGNYLYATGGIDRTQDLVAGTKVHVKMDGQVSDAPLINNEQYAGGGLQNVRGYYETDALGDSAVHCTVELLAPEMAASHGVCDGKLQSTPFVFFDRAHLFVLDALPSQQNVFDLTGTGVGVRGLYDKCLEYETCWATALTGTEHTKAGDNKVQFRVKYLY